MEGKWPGSVLIIAARSVGTRAGRPLDETCPASSPLAPGQLHCRRTETRYYATSLRSAPAALHRLIRQGWSVENSWHWVRDTQLNEDAHRLRERNGVQVLATLRSMGLNTMRLAGMDSISNGIAAFAHDIKHLLELLGWRNREGLQPAPSRDF